MHLTHLPVELVYSRLARVWRHRVEETIQLDLARLGWALGLMVIAVGLSLWQHLGLEWKLGVATGRTIVQLLAVGYFLAVAFSIQNSWLVLAIIGVMMFTATVVARNRISRKLPQLLPLLGGVLFCTTTLTLAYVHLLVIRPQPWFDPQYLIPLAGILLGNAMNAAAIAGERLVTNLNSSQIEIETHLSLGATPAQATQQYRNDAIQAGLIPILNAMTVIGIVTLPGIITGQILAGADPFNAALYQMLIMFMLAFVDLLASLLVTQGIYRQFFNGAAQFTRH
ncbi:iron export ABC transporter permease subunit FetB [Leptolyngbya sp. FACHB-16]|nr:iron export ABC transporter permease subunit FetB [Leptolyngbya sp. FACHB-8]MBD2154242.1 iron export ABC transporter permease subunit FetB [Leptolyngbya sp. FACHB-16]